LSITAQGYFQWVISSHRMVFMKHPRCVPHDADVAQMLASLPLLQVLDLSVCNGRNPHVTFATANYDGVVARRLRTLKAAGAAQLRGAGMRAPSRMAFAMSREEFVDGLLELPVAADGAAAVTLETQRETRCSDCGCRSCGGYTARTGVGCPRRSTSTRTVAAGP
jgi:hypothetical protein